MTLEAKPPKTTAPEIKTVEVSEVDGVSAGLSIRKHAIIGWLALALLIGGVGGWAVTAELAGAVVASGLLVVESDVKKVQHPTGGVIGELLVRDGSRVEGGDVLVRLDETVTRSNLAIVVKSLNELNVRKARLEAERDDADRVVFPSHLTALTEDPEIGDLMTGEARLFELRRSARQGQKAQLQERIGQLDEEIAGLTGQSNSKRREITFIHQELVGVRELWEKRLVPINRVMTLERESVRLDGESNQLIAAAAQAKGKKIETGLQIIQIDQDLRSDVAKELREIQGKTAELVERKVAAEDQLKRIDIRAPQSGTIHQLSVHTVGGVVGASETLMLIVPDEDALNVEVKLSPSDIDQVHVGQPAVLRFSAFSQRTTPEINGVVSRVSADITQDQKTSAAYYIARVTMPKNEIARLGQVRLMPGMPVEAFIQTDTRTVASYLVKPLHDQIMRAFRER
uniref:Membrane fusion protein (MFP) family protein n=1 Tax=Rhodopseudomonas palustris (strain DX-1) TaxID=652103 RepID=E6VQ13_RHOPX